MERPSEKAQELVSPTGVPIDPELLKELEVEYRTAEFNPDEARDDHGRWTDEVGGELNKSEIALKNANPYTKEKDEWATRSEAEIVGLLPGSVPTDNNAPVDVILRDGKRTFGFEVKTLLDNTNDKITVRGEALDRKIAWARSNHASLHTIIIDDRRAFGKVADSGHRIYYRRGVGSFRLSSLRKVESGEHLRRLLRIKS